MSSPSSMFLYDLALADEIEYAFGRLARAVVCHDEINERAGEAATALSRKPLSLAHVLEQLESCRFPFALRSLDRQTSFSRERVPSHLSQFLRLSLASLAANAAAQVEIKVDQTPDEEDADFDAADSILSTRVSAFNATPRSRGELEARVRRDAEAALTYVSSRTPGVFACDLFAALLTDAADLTKSPSNNDVDSARVARMRKIRHRYPTLWQPLSK